MKRPTLTATIMLGFGLGLVLLLVISIVAYRDTRTLIDTNRQVVHTQEVLVTLERVLSELKDAETGQRGYLITGEEPYLEPYRAALSTVERTMQQLRRLTAETPAQEQRLAALEPLVRQKLAELQETIDVRTRVGFAAAAQIVRTDRGKRLMDNIRAVVQDMVSAERTLLSQRTHTTEAGAQTTLSTIVYGNVLACVVVALASYTISRQLTKRRQAEQALAALNADLEQRVTDRTEALRRSEEAERAQREYFEVTLRSIGDAVIVTNPLGEVTFLNRVAEALTGWRLADGRGKLLPEVFHIVHEETRQPVENPVAKVLRTGSIAGLANHTILIRKDGSVCPIDDSAAPICDEHGHLLGIVLVFRDVTARRQAEYALRASEEKYRGLFNAIDEGFCLIEKVDGDAGEPVEFRYLEANPAFATQTGVGDTAGKTIGQVFPGEPQEWRDTYDAVLRTGEPKRFERTLVSQGRVLELYAFRVEDGTQRRVAVLFTDITARKQAEDTQARLLAEVRRANDELQQFAYIVSHDLSEPLRTVASYVQLLARNYQGRLDAAADEYITFAVEGAQRMQQMLTALLAYTRAGGQRQEFTAVDCEAVLRRVLADLHVTITESEATITRDPLPTVPGDATRLGQVFQNLVGNALKFRHTAPPHIHIAAQREGAVWRFAVRDNGIGIDPRQAGRLFQVFQRLHPRQQYPGSGIGLAICKKVVESHHGKIWVESEPGRGATFFFTLPATAPGEIDTAATGGTGRNATSLAG